jgi:hypothetical protein
MPFLSISAEEACPPQSDSCAGNSLQLAKMSHGRPSADGHPAGAGVGALALRGAECCEAPDLEIESTGMYLGHLFDVALRISRY